MTKEEIRKMMKAKRRALTADELSANSAAITGLLLELPEFRSAKSVMLYMSSFREPSTEKILDTVLSEKRAVIPVSDTLTHTITPSYIFSRGDLTAGAYGIPEPKTVTPADISDIDIVLVPGIAFDRHGARIGFGQGYYDRFLSRFRGTKIGICHDMQLLDSVPSLPHDSKMDMIITEKGILNDF